MNVTDIVSEFGAFYLNSGQGPRDLAQLINFRAETDELFTEVRTDNTIIRRSITSVSRVLQPFQKDYTPNGEATFTPQEIKLYGIKVDVREYPDELVETWLGFLASQNTDRKTWPFIRWWINQIAMKQAEDWEINEVFGGVYAAPTAGTPGAAGTAINGLRKLINDGITATDITAISTGAPDADDELFVAQVEEFVDAIDVRYRTAPMTIAMNLDNAAKYKRGMRAKYNMNYAQANDLMQVINYPNITVKGYRSFGSSNKFVCSPRENLILGKKNAGRSVSVESVDRQVKLWWDEHRGVGYVIPELVFTNDQDLV